MSAEDVIEKAVRNLAEEWGDLVSDDAVDTDRAIILKTIRSEGYKLVPVKLTAEMREAALNSKPGLGNIYRAILEASE